MHSSGQLRKGTMGTMGTMGTTQVAIWNPYGIHMESIWEMMEHHGTSWNIMAMDGAIAQHSTTLNGDHGDKARLFFVPHDSLRN